MTAYIRTEVVVLEAYLPVAGKTSIPVSERLDPLVEAAVAPDGGGEGRTEGAKERHGFGGWLVRRADALPCSGWTRLAPRASHRRL
jgi:hypothetical protein